MNIAAAKNDAMNSLESEAAKALGYIIFEFTRLDMELGLILVWSGDGRKLEQLTKELDGYNFNNKLALLKEKANLKYKDTPALKNYSSWLRKAHAVRILRNDFFHGRWGFIPEQQCVANVVGLPTSSKQTETRYTVAQLQESRGKISALRNQLSELRAEWPV